MDTLALEKIGLTKGESKVYMALLKTGLTSVGPLVKHSEVSRSKIYEIMNRLLSKGLVSTVTDSGVKKFKAVDPRLIPEYLEKEKQAIEKQKQDFTKTIPALLAEIQLSQKEQSIEVYEGWQGFKNVFNLILKEVKKGDQWYAFGIPKTLEKERARFFSNYRRKTDKIGVDMYLIANEEIRGSAELAPKSKYSHLRFVKQETPTSVEVVNDYTIIGVWSNKPITILIKGNEVADSFKKYFDNMWKLAKP